MAEIVGVIAASLEIVKVARACLVLFNSVRDIDLLAREQKDAHFKLVIQGVKFERWCSSLGIQDVIWLQDSRQPEERQRAEEMAILERAFVPELRLKSPGICTLTQSTLEGMRKKFDNAFNILQRYSQTTDDAPLNGEPKSLGKRWSKLVKKGGSGSVGHSKIGGTTALGSSSRGLSAVPSAARWAVSDKKTMNDLLDSIEQTNDLLLELVQPSLQTQIDRRTDMAILSQVNQSTLDVTHSFPEGSDIKALARIKQWQIHEENENRDEDASLSSSITSTGEEYSSRRVQPYHLDDFKRGTLRHGEYRSLSELDAMRVMVEWKYYNQDHPIRMEQTLRLGGLVSLLNRNELFHRFNTLPCKGLVNDLSNSRIGIVFATGNSSTRTMRTLQDTIKDEETPWPLGWRFTLAQRLVTALHHLHSVHWFHKSVRSDNIISFPTMSSPQDSSNRIVTGKRRSIAEPFERIDEAIRKPEDPNVLEPGRRVLTKAPAAVPPFYLVGWDLSRPDHPSELSETLSISTSGYQTKRDAIEMYSHPATHVRPGTAKRPRYRAEFDIYSMGLVLLEIGLWRTVDTVRARCRDDAEFRSRICGEYCDRLLSRMGVIYWRVVQRCLCNDFEPPDNSQDAVTDDFRLQVAFEKNVVSELEKCCA